MGLLIDKYNDYLEKLRAVNQSPFYDFLKKNNIDKGIL